jgi:cysteine desulfurase/selenocysteine lyase
MRRFGVAATLRASFGAYNTHAEIDALVEGLAEAKRMLR